MRTSDEVVADLREQIGTNVAMLFVELAEIKADERLRSFAGSVLERHREAYAERHEIEPDSVPDPREGAGPVLAALADALDGR